MSDLLNSLRFIRWLTVTIFISIIVIVIFVITVDPYGQYRLIEYPGFNVIKPTLGRYQNEIKLTQALRLRPNAVILGNSRAEIGLDPEAPEFNQHGLIAYNLAIPGIGIETAQRQLNYLIQGDIKPKSILLGLEFLDFIAPPQLLPDSPLKTHHLKKPQNEVGDWFWQFDSLFSLASVKDSVRTLLIQNDDEAGIITSRGFNPLKQYKPITRTEGYYKLFQQRAQENTKVYLMKSKGLLSLDDFNHLRAIFDIAAQYNSEINLIIYPYHAQILALFEETGLWPAFVEWKRSLVNEIDAVKQHYSNARVTLYDFSGYSRYNCERIPSIEDRKTSTQWYWEAGHFKKELGDIILKRIFATKESSRKINGEQDKFQPSFGFELNKSNFFINQSRIAQEHSDCVNAYPELFAEVTSLVAAFRGKY